MKDKDGLIDVAIALAEGFRSPLQSDKEIQGHLR